MDYYRAGRLYKRKKYISFRLINVQTHARQKIYFRADLIKEHFYNFSAYPSLMGKVKLKIDWLAIMCNTATLLPTLQL